MSLTRASRRVLHESVPTMQTFQDGGVVSSYNDLFLTEDNVIYKWTGALPHAVIAGSKPDSGWINLTRLGGYDVNYKASSMEEALSGTYKEGDTITVGDTVFKVYLTKPSHSFIPLLETYDNKWLVPYLHTSTAFNAIVSESTVTTTGVTNSTASAQQLWLNKDKTICYQAFNQDSKFFVEAYNCNPANLSLGSMLFRTGQYAGNHGATITMSDYDDTPVVWAHMDTSAPSELQGMLCGFRVSDGSADVTFQIPYPPELHNTYFRTELYGIDELLLWSEYDSYVVKLSDLYKGTMYPVHLGKTGHQDLITSSLQSAIFMGKDTVTLGGGNTSSKGNVILHNSSEDYVTNIYIPDRESEPEGLYPVWNSNTLKYDFLSSFRKSRRDGNVYETVYMLVLGNAGKTGGILLGTKSFTNDGYNLYTNSNVNIQKTLTFTQYNRPQPYDAAVFGCRDITDTTRDWFGMDFWGEEYRIIVAKDHTTNLPLGMHFKAKDWTDYRMQFRSNTLYGVPTITLGSARRLPYTDQTVCALDVVGNQYGVALQSGAKVAVLPANYLAVTSDSSFLKIGNVASTTGITKDTAVSDTLHIKKDTLNPAVDGSYDLGAANYRFRNVYSTNGSINTSDERLKHSFARIEDAEREAGKLILQDIRKFRTIDGDRIHFGVSAQNVVSIMEQVGLKPFDYSFICHEKWDDVYEDGVLVKQAGDRYGIRYSELLLFVMASVLQ